MLVLGIESSCDETAAAIVSDARAIRANVVLSQNEAHQPYGGVVPEIAARSHIDHMDGIIQQALTQAGCGWEEIDGIAATTGPGLIGGVIVGTMTGKALASVLKKPFIAVNHLEGHALTARLTDAVEFPYLLLLVSGGHCQILAVEGVGKYQRLGGTIDDAMGEAFDKSAKLLGLGYPGGPAVEKLALQGNPKRFVFPKPLSGREGYDFSFSGLKTAVRLAAIEAKESGGLNDQTRADICASFQYTVGEILRERLGKAMRDYAKTHKQPRLVIAGGVAANKYLGGVLGEMAKEQSFSLTIPPAALCTDNAAMIAWVGIERLQQGMISDLQSEPKARWPLSELA